VVPDDARDLDRDVLAYRREMRAKRRRERLARALRPLRGPGIGPRVAIVPLIAVCLALALVGGALLSVATMSPAAAPTLGRSQASGPEAELSDLPAGSVQLDRRQVAVRSLVTSAIALVPADCDCGIELSRLSGQVARSGLRVYFSGATQPIAELDTLATQFGNRVAVGAADTDRVLATRYRPSGLTVLLVFEDARAEVLRNLPATFELSPTLRRLGQPSSVLGA
jgi:hypothetical protein